MHCCSFLKEGVTSDRFHFRSLRCLLLEGVRERGGRKGVRGGYDKVKKKGGWGRGRKIL